MPRVTGLGHVGLYVHDFEAMVEFYSGFLGLKVSDIDEIRGCAYLSTDPDDEHHEVVLGSMKKFTGAGREADESVKTVRVLQQLSFPVATFDDLQQFYRQIVERKYRIDMVVSHGNSFGCYFFDPEGNRVEVYWPTGIHWPQPHRENIDLNRSYEELMADLNAMVAANPVRRGNKSGLTAAQTDAGERAASWVPR